MRAYKISNNPKHIYQLCASKYKHVMDEHKYNKHARYKHKWIEREMSNRKHGRICFEIRATCSMSPPSPQWRISTKIDHARSFGTATPTASSLKNSWTHKNPHLFPQEQYTTRTRKFVEAATSNFSLIQRWKLCDHFLITNKLSHIQGSL